MAEPVILSSQRRGVTVEAATTSISKEIKEVFNYALVWGTSTKHDPQRCGLSHVLEDQDVLQIVPKTVSQQKKAKDYAKKVQAARDALAERGKSKPKLKT